VAANRLARWSICLLFLVLFASTSAGPVVAQSAPDCSTITYNGSGTGSNPYEVGNVDELQRINKSTNTRTNDTFVQVSDINASETSSWNGGNGFEPIGSNPDGDTGFMGIFNGNYYNITGMYVDRPTDNVALFAVLGDGAFIRSMILNRRIRKWYRRSR